MDAYTEDAARRYAAHHHVTPAAPPEDETTVPPPPADTGGSGCSDEYEGACVPTDVGDVDCPDIPESDFRSVGSDPDRLDADGDGIACES